ncbi:MAG: DNA-binding protein WhiA [Ruminococcus sp.]|nr:DNA-binding protein WhiA [Ruminococcus sp.]
MSFSGDVRREICSYINDKDKKFACLYGMLLFGRRLSREKISFRTESRTSAETFVMLFKSVMHRDINFKEKRRRDGSVLYSFDIYDSDILDKVFWTYHFSENERSIDCETMSTGSLGVFTAGVFLACGSVNDPNKEYHLEFISPCESLADELVSLLKDIGVNAKTAVRRNQYVVYVKGSESIEDTLTFIGAPQCTLEIMNVKIYKDVRNKANRITNCDSANIDKVINAAMKQTEDIKLIISTNGIESLNSELREVALMRLENVGMSLKDIGENLSEPISRSGVNHRFKKIAKIADDIRKGVTN